MSTRLRSFALSAFALLLLSLPAFGQMTAIEGDIKGPDGKPLPNAVVKFDRTDIKGSYQVKTDKKGHYGHYGLPSGMYDVSVVVDGQVKDAMKGVKTNYSNAQTVNFALKAPGTPADEGLSAAQDAERGMTKEQKAAFDKANSARAAQLAKNKELNDSYTAGKAALEAKQWDAAIEAFTKASTLDDKQVVVWAGLADAYIGAAPTKGAEAAAFYDKGFDAYKKAIELKPDEAAYYNNFAIALAKDKKLDDAKLNLDKAAQLDPPGAGKYFYNMGALLVNSGQNDAAGGYSHWQVRCAARNHGRAAEVYRPERRCLRQRHGHLRASGMRTGGSGEGYDHAAGRHRSGEFRQSERRAQEKEVAAKPGAPLSKRADRPRPDKWLI